MLVVSVLSVGTAEQNLKQVDNVPGLVVSSAVSDVPSAG